MGIIEELLKEEKVSQKAPAYPIFVLPIGDTFLHLAKYLEYSYHKLILKIDDGLGSFEYIKSDFSKVYESAMSRLNRDSGFLQQLKKIYEDEYNRALSAYQKARDFKSANNLLMLSVGVAHIIEPLSILGTHYLKDLLSLKIKEPSELTRVLNALTSPETKSFSNDYDESLLKTIKDKSLVKSHLEKYYWIKNSYAGSFKLSEKDLQEQSLKPLSKDYFDNIKKEKAEVKKKYKLDKKILELAEHLLFLTSWQDERKINILKAITELDLVLHKLSREYKISFKDMRNLLPEEILNRKIPPKQELEKRRVCFLWFFDTTLENNSFLISGKEALDLYNKYNKKSFSSVQSISGMGASSGAAIGRVSICKTLEDIKNFKQGDILVTSMTRPEYLPAMKKSLAIVTDEGGITCHAAIVARELRIPAVIGTKNATEILKNGDLVEVKANHNTVIILERSQAH